MNRTQVSKVWLTNSSVWVELKDGRRAEELFSDYSRLSQASETQKKNFVLSYFGIHWPEIDEDLSFDGFFNKHRNDIESSDEA